MQIEYELNKKDCYNCGKDIYKIKRIKKRYSYLLYIPLIFFIISIIAFFFSNYKLFSFLFTATIILVALSLFIKLSLILITTIDLYTNSKQGSFKASLSVNESCINYSARGISSNIQWNSIIDIYNTKNMLFIFISQLVAIPVPKRVFTNESELNNFWNIVVDNYKKTH